jgi:hypothetical protein
MVMVLVGSVFDIVHASDAILRPVNAFLLRRSIYTVLADGSEFQSYIWMAAIGFRYVQGRSLLHCNNIGRNGGYGPLLVSLHFFRFCGAGSAAGVRVAGMRVADFRAPANKLIRKYSVACRGWRMSREPALPKDRANFRP